MSRTIARTTAEARALLIDMIPAAAQHNAAVRPNPKFRTTEYMIEKGEFTLVAALYVQIDERIAREVVEQALTEMWQAGTLHAFPESLQSDLTDLERQLAVRLGAHEMHWLQISSVHTN